jgi:type II secretory pathway pseudopilin PulG
MKGVSQVEFLVVLLLVFIALAITWPYLMRSDSSDAELTAINRLKQIHLAQADYYGGRRLYGDEQQLKSFGVLNDSTPSARAPIATLSEPPLTYTVQVTVSGSRTKWCAAAIPSRTSGRWIAIDETGAVMFGRSCVDGSVQ